MTLLNTGIGIMVYGTPVLLIILTILVSITEAYYLKKHPIKFWILVKKLIVANLVTTIVGFLFILVLNLTDSLMIIATFLIEHLNMEKFSLLYSTALSLLIVIPNYIITVVIEFSILKRTLSKDLALKDILIVNFISYVVLIFIWLIFLKSLNMVN